jgi:DNA-binding transcriptional ArsR family regulator
MTSMDTLQLVAEPRRQQILRAVWRDELAVGEIAQRIQLSYAGVSQHLALLRDAGLVTVRPDGKRRMYRADHNGLGPFKEFLESLWAQQLDRLAMLAEEAERP